MYDISFTFRLISPRIARHSWWSFFSSFGIKRAHVLTLQSRCKSTARHGCPVWPLIPTADTPGTLSRRQSRDPSQAAQEVHLPPEPNQPILSVTNNFLKQVLLGTWNTDCPGNGGLKASSQLLLEMGRKNPGQVLPFLKWHPRWSLLLEIEVDTSGRFC